MMRKILPVFFYLLLNTLTASSQADPFVGSWQTDYTNGESSLQFILQVAAPEKSLLYPAHITIQCDSFTADYELLLVKKKCEGTCHQQK
jgi:hypothetical protein